MSRIYQYNDRYFKNINTIDKAYWLGYLYADGYVGQTPYRIILTSKDKEVLQNFKRCLKSNLPIHEDNRENKLRYFVSIGSKQMVKDLIKVNCLSPKSLTIRFPNFLKSYLIRHFIRGFFDGDGWIGNYKNEIKHFVLGFCSGSKKFLISLRNVLYNELKFKKVRIYKALKGNCYSLVYGIAKRKYKIYRYLYNNANIFLTRKHKIFKERIK